MAWYYAGPEAKPLGPVSAEQLQALCAGGTITPETFVIEHTGPGAANLAWKRYREVFPPAPVLPPLPSAAPTGYYAGATPPPAPVPNSPGAHPLFPSAGGAHAVPAMPPATPHPPLRGTNGWCVWGFVLSLIALPLAFACVGIVPALIAVVLCVIGLVQLNRHREEGGVGLGVAGLIFSGVALLIAIVLIAIFSPSIMKAHGLTVTEETSNDSE